MPRFIKSTLLFLTIVLLPFDDSHLQATPLRAFGASLCLLPLLLLIIIHMWEFVPKMNLKVLRWGTIYLAYSITVSVAYVEIYGANFDMAFLAKKAGANFILLTIWLLAIFVFAQGDKGTVRTAVYFAFAISILGVITGDVLSMSTINAMVHYHPNSNMRPRGWSMESSTLGVQVTILGLLASHYLPSRPARILIGGIVVLVLVYSGTKGGLLALAAATGIASILMPADKPFIPRPVQKFLQISAGLLAAIYGIRYVDPILHRAALESTTITTRASLILAVISAAFHNPLGVGCGGIIPAFRIYLPSVMSSLARLGLPTHFQELSNYINTATGIDVDAKTVAFNLLLMLGWPGFVVYVYTNVRLLRSLVQRRVSFSLLVAAIFAIIASVTYYSSFAAYSVPLAYGFSLAAL